MSWHNTPHFQLPPACKGADIANNPVSADDGNVASQVGIPFYVSDGDTRTLAKDFDGNLSAEGHHEDTGKTTSSASKFEEVLQRIRESPSTEPCATILHKDDFQSPDSTLLHYIAARGRLKDVLKEVLQCSNQYGYPVDVLDEHRMTPLRVAIRHDRYDNVVALLDSGAAVDLTGSDGELPLHVAITYCGDARIVKEIYSRFEDGAKLRVQSPSEREGQVALDLAISRLLREVPEFGEAVCTQETKKMFVEIVKTTPTIEDTTYLERHADEKWTLFLQAITAVVRLPCCRELIETMSQVAYEREHINKHWYWFRYINQDLLQGHLA